MVWAQGSLISTDQDNKIFSWSPDYKAHLLKGDPHTSVVNLLAANATHLFSASVDGTIKRSGSVGDNIFEFQASNKLESTLLALAIG
jgi:hypothetical protein